MRACPAEGVRAAPGSTTPAPTSRSARTQYVPDARSSAAPSPPWSRHTVRSSGSSADTSPSGLGHDRSWSMPWMEGSLYLSLHLPLPMARAGSREPISKLVTPIPAKVEP